MQKKLISLLLVLLLSTTIIFYPAAIASPLNTPRKIHIDALAVTESGEGVVIGFDVWVTPGTGKLVVLGNRDLLGNDVIESLNFSTWLAARLACIPHNLFNYYVEYRGESSVEGLSATLLFTLAYLTLLRGDPWDGKATATGLIAPSGIVGNVSSVEKKYEVAVKHGYNRVLAPVYPVLLNETMYRPVVSIIDSYEEFTLKPLYPRYDVVLEKELMNKSSVFEEVLYGSWKYFYNKSLSIINYLKNYVPDNPEIKSYYEKGYASLNESLVYAREKLYYTAASRAFYGYWNLYTVYIYMSYNQGASLSSYIRLYEGSLKKLNETLTKYISSPGNLTLYSLDVLINVYERLFDSIESYNTSLTIVNKGIRSSDDLVYFAGNISYAIARVYTAEQWLRLIEYGGGFNSLDTLDQGLVKKVVYNEYGLVESFAGLLESLGLSNARKYVEERLSNKWFWSNNIILLSRIMWIERGLSNFLLSIPQYTLLSDLVREGIRVSVVRLLEYFNLYYGVVIPSAYTALEYYTTSEGYGVLPLSSSILHMLVLYEVAGMKEHVVIAEHAPLQHFRPSKVVVLSIALIALGSFVIGYAIGLHGGKVRED